MPFNYQICVVYFFLTDQQNRREHTNLCGPSDTHFSEKNNQHDCTYVSTITNSNIASSLKTHWVDNDIRFKVMNAYRQTQTIT